MDQNVEKVPVPISSQVELITFGTYLRGSCQKWPTLVAFNFLNSKLVITLQFLVDFEHNFAKFSQLTTKFFRNFFELSNEMTALTFFGTAFTAFGMSLALFVLTISKVSPKIRCTFENSSAESRALNVKSYGNSSKFLAFS